MKVILDTNVIIKVWKNGGDSPSKRLYKLITQRKLDLCLSADCFLEFKLKICDPKFADYFNKKLIATSFAWMKYNCQFYEINEEVEFERDPSDKHLLELALASNADFLLTYDKDLLELKKFKKTKIIKPTDFLK
ncbi:MAG: putative toxin-antitoxin system toxin component, PIN family [bacterium]